jgi:hypothetical protein
MEGLDTIELFIDESREEDGIEAISLVESPAIEENFIALSKHKVEFKTIDSDKRIIVGLALVPDKLIYRRRGDYEYNIVFSKDTVRKASELYLKRLKINNATLEHDDQMTSGVSVIESWIVEDPNKDKTALYGLNAVQGAWAVTMKIDNDEVWEDVKAGKYLGLSIEGMFSDNVEDVEEIEAADVLEQIKNMLKEELVEYPHFMYDPKTGDEVKIVDKEEHDKYTKKGWVHSKPNEYKEQELKSYSDYPQSAKNNAKKALKYKKENGSSCGTSVGWTRANQLASGKAISRETIARMASFKRHQQHKDVPYSEGCGGIMWDAWGGTSGVEWAIRKLKQIDK